MITLAFHLSTRDQPKTWAQHLSKMDIPHSPVKPAGRFGFMIELRDPDGTQIELRDPDGTQIELFAPT